MANLTVVCANGKRWGRRGGARPEGAVSEPFVSQANLCQLDRVHHAVFGVSIRSVGMGQNLACIAANPSQIHCVHHAVFCLGNGISWND